MTSSDDAIVEVEQQLGMLFGRARLLWKHAAAQIHPDLQPVGYKVLSTIVRLGETNASALVELLDTDKSIVSRQLRMLEETGLVVTKADDTDRRARLLSASPDAIERVTAGIAARRERLRDLLRTMPDEKLRSFAQMLELLGDL